MAQNKAFEKAEKLKSNRRDHKLLYRHYLPASMTKATIKIILAGVGGNGSQVLTDLARMHQVLTFGLDRPGFDVYAFDGDTITRANIGRQLFSQFELNANKAVAMTTRINNFFGMSWSGIPSYLTREPQLSRTAGYLLNNSILITCVDSAKARIEIKDLIIKLGDERFKTIYHLDMGNKHSVGQAIIGTIGDPVPQPFLSQMKTVETLPTVFDMFPDAFKRDNAEDDTPSCSMSASLTRQSLFINKIVASVGMNLLWEGLYRGYFDFHAVFVNADDYQLKAKPVTPQKSSHVRRRKK